MARKHMQKPGTYKLYIGFLEIQGKQCKLRVLNENLDYFFLKKIKKTKEEKKKKKRCVAQQRVNLTRKEGIF